MDESGRLRDEWLALRCQSGDPKAFRALVDELQAPLLYYASKLTGNFETAKDIVQDAWIRASRDLGKLEAPGAIRAWLYRIVHGLAIDRVRRDFARERAEDVVIDRASDTAVDPGFSADSAEAVHHALDQLPAKQREVLTLFFLEQFSIQEISTIVRCAEGTVKSRLHYAKSALRTALQQPL